MLVKLVLTKFKKHENLTVNFTGGLNVIRGANEAGKSTLYHAVAYALYGSRGLPESLDETVTYGFPASQLKVELVFTHAGITYTIIRSKAGASVVGGGVKAEGQDGVTSFVTTLFGVKQDVASKIMIANQSSLKAAVEGGQQAINLIETLSDVELIDTLISRVQGALPCGNTSGLEKQIADLAEEKAPVADFTGLEDNVNSASHVLGQSSALINRITAELEDLPIQEARQTALRVATLRGEAESIREQKNAAAAILSQPEPMPVTDRSAEYAAEIEADRIASERLKAYKKFAAIKQVSESLGARKDVLLSLQMLKTEQQKLTRIVQGFALQVASIKASKITDKSCALCGKLLEDVPEVVTVNTRLEEKLQGILTTQTHNQTLLDETTAKIEAYEAALKVDQELYRMFSSIEAYIKIYDTVPAQARWLGEVPVAGDTADWRALMQQNKKEYVAYLQQVKVRSDAEATLTKCNGRLAELTLEDDSEAIATISKWDSLQGQFQQAQLVYSRDRDAYLTAENQLSTAKQVFAGEVARYKLVQDQLKTNKLLLAEYRDNNDLIQRLRQARPLVAQQLWTTVLGAVSHYFSRIRGTPALVTKSDKGFMVDAKSYTNLSGSTIDSLGLAVRMSLQKTFLPNVDFMLLDEPASGCDETRELAMLGVLASSGYNQVVLVTHSERADTFAAQVITI